ncbi:MAG: protein-disulfide reductase DsbD domain-containing protein [Vicinamibacterales bacterium]
MMAAHVWRQGRFARRTVAAWFGCAALLASAAPAAAQTTNVQHATVTLVSEEGALKPGAPAWVGVLFDMEPGWHIYWVNPGDAGDPPRLRWELPAGFKAGDIRWPVPIRLVLGPVIDYGYEGRVLLALPIDVPADYKPGTPITLAADVRYVICKDVCIPARTRVTLPMPVPASASPAPAARRTLFADTRARWPQALPSGWSASASAAGKQITLTLRTGKSEPSASFFPLEFDQIDNGAPQSATPTPTGLQLALTRSDPESPPPAVLRGVAVLSGGRAYEINAEVR